jgi:uncharacterized membrane protein YraQ (UPF0718 family)
MRLILLLITAVIIGFLLEKQLGSNSTESEIGHSENNVVPKPPRNKQDLQNLKKDLNQLMLDTKDKKAENIKQTLNN